ncbi:MULTISPECIES: ABC transporter substrate-binding protein [Paenibacillus]|uniref:ABC transporter substrate-binding protein n=1 Tax=Paenibacillus TaxID=44249 RepID=UPI0022B8FEEA|nr:ABC transporter substrate-binding protein [Paenibacillus caseinilyticus]MCZ8521654.1 ABC transporter substrate-binding protein [Paenibacillus caseinilyticus]
MIRQRSRAGQGRGALLLASLAIAAALTGCGAGQGTGTSGDVTASAKPAAASGDGTAAGKQALVTVGYQSPTAQTWGALIMKNRKLYEKHLKELAPADQVEVKWFDATAGSILNNNMVGGKIQLSILGDMPSLLNGVMGLTQPNYHSVFLAFDGKGELGRNQAIVVPKGSGIRQVADLAGQTVSTPIGSSSHRMLLETLRQHGLAEKVKIVDQSVTVGMQSIEQGKVAAHSTWEPYPSLIGLKGIGTILQPGEATKIDYLAGVVANKDWAGANRIYVTAFLRALIEAHQFAKEHPEETAKIFEEESKFPPEVCRKMVENIRFDAAVYTKDLGTLDGSIQFLSGLGKLEKKLELGPFVDENYLREAAESLKVPYLTETERAGEWLRGKEL